MLKKDPFKILTEESGSIKSMRYSENHNILITGSVNKKSITIWSVPYFDILSRAKCEYEVSRIEIMNHNSG